MKKKKRGGGGGDGGKGNGRDEGIVERKKGKCTKENGQWNEPEEEVEEEGVLGRRQDGVK